MPNEEDETGANGAPRPPQIELGTCCPHCAAILSGAEPRGPAPGERDRTEEFKKYGPQNGDLGVCPRCYEPFLYILATVALPPGHTGHTDQRLKAIQAEARRRNEARRFGQDFSNN